MKPFQKVNLPTVAVTGRDAEVFGLGRGEVTYENAGLFETLANRC
jgi:hypothetical protein